MVRAAIKHGDEVLEVAGKQATEVLETLPLRRLDAGDSSVGRGGGKVNQVHHFATDKNKKYTQAFQDVTDKYGLNLDDDRNKALLPHQGRHPNAYHDFILDEMKNIDNIATAGLLGLVADTKKLISNAGFEVDLRQRFAGFTKSFAMA